MTNENSWLAIGFLGQGLFTARFVVQWLASERQKNSVVPKAFWWFSLLGGLALLCYALSRRDPVIVLGQSMGIFVYIRNLMLMHRAERRAAASSSSSVTAARVTPQRAARNRPHFGRAGGSPSDQGDHARSQPHPAPARGEHPPV